MNNQAKLLPSVDHVLQLQSTQRLLGVYDREWVVMIVRAALQRIRANLFTSANNEVLSRHELLSMVEADLSDAVHTTCQSSFRRAINATGVILHTGLGRAPLPPAARSAVIDAVENYSNLEIDLERGVRGSRLTHLEGMICHACGAEAAVVVNNNAAAVMLMLSSLARGKEVIISRGELVEIGGSFRIPDIIEASGARLREVGTTNRTHCHDYEAVINEESAVILAVHPSNYRVRGFTSSVDLQELSEISRRTGIPLIYDLGGGAIIDLEDYDLPPEPIVAECLQHGVDLVSFSGDKVLGGPQAGIIAGKKVLVDSLCKNPMIRALRCDKMTIAALEATLRLYRLNSANLCAGHPVLKMMTEDVELVRQRGKALIAKLSVRSRKRLKPIVKDNAAEVGSGAMPLEELKSAAVNLHPVFCTSEQLARTLRMDDNGVVGRIHRDVVLLDMRTVRDDEVALIVASLERAAAD